MRPQSWASQSPAAPRLAAARLRVRSASAPLSRSATSSTAIRRAVPRSIGASPGVAATVTAGTRPVASRAGAVDAGAESRPAATTTPSARAVAAPSRADVQPVTPPRRVLPASTSSRGRAAQTIVSAPSTASFAENSLVQGAMSSVASNPTDTAYTRRPRGLSGIVRGSVIMKKRKTRTSGEVTRSHHRSTPAIGPRCHAAVISCPVAASTATPAANVSQKPAAIPTRCSRERIASPPPTMSASASASHTDIGPHQNASGSACSGPRSTKQSTSPKFEGLKMCRPRKLITYFDRRPTAAVPAKIHQPFMLHQSPCSVPGTRSTNATPFPVRRALAGHMRTCWRRKAIDTSSTAHVTSETRICAIESLKSNAVCPSTCRVTITPARCSRGSRHVGSSTG